MTKYALVTGVLGGIGSVISRKLKESGYYVYGLDVRDDFDYKCDRFILFDINQFVADSSYRIRFTEIFNNLIPNLHLLVNNAAVQRLDTLDNLKIDEWNETLNVNLTGPLLLSKLFLNRLEQAKGSIINIGSIHERLTKKRFISYATSKSALVGLTRAMAVDLEGRVRVNAVSPAAIETKMLLEGFDNNEEKVKELEALHPVQRIGYPEDVAKLVLFLASENNGFIHGANISLDGGISSVLKDL